MLQKLVLGICVSATLVGCKQNCEENNSQADSKPAIKVSELSPILQDFFGTDEAHTRGVQAGKGISQIGEEDKDLIDKTSFYLNFMPDMGDMSWADVYYYFDENNTITKVESAITPQGIDPYEVGYEITNYLDSKYGPHYLGHDYEKIWNNLNEKDSSLVIFSLVNEIPTKKYTISKNEETGKIDTTQNYETVNLKIEYVDKGYDILNY